MNRRILIHIWALAAFICAGSSYAMDTDLYTGKSVVVPPNVLIIFDTSGSMDDRVPDRTYDPTYDYSTEPGGTSYTNDWVYYWKETVWSGDWEKFANSVAELNCDDAKLMLNTNGRWTGNIDSGYYCTENDDDFETLCTGRFLNYYESDLTPFRRKLEVARTAIKNLLQNMLDEGTSIRVGLMRFNTSNRGGHISVPIRDLDTAQKTLLDSALDGYTANGATPLAESLAEAGLYYAGKQSWANTSTTEGMIPSTTTYISPIEWRCQQNHIVLMTDGNSWYDQGDGNGTNIFTRSDYINGKSINDRDNDGADPGTDGNGGTHWLDDVAKFLYDEDLVIAGNDPSGEPFEEYTYSPDNPPVEFERQNVHTHTIGFATGTNDLLLRRAAADSSSIHGSHGNGLYRASYSTTEIEQAFADIFGSIVEKNVNLSAPVVPVSQLDHNYSGRNIYIGMFHPMDSPFWYGNIKKYALDKEGNLYQKDGVTLATDSNGVILYNASSCYSSLDGFYVNKGGVGERLLYQNNRRFFTYKDDGTAATKDLTAPSNAFSDTNAEVLTRLGVADPLDLIHFLRAEDIYDPDEGQEAKKRSWVLGDLIHSKPVIQQVEGTTEKVILVGSNDGFLHCFVDDDKGDNEKSEDVLVVDHANDEVREAWCFVPWDLIPNLKNLKTQEASHQIFVDGSPVLYPSGTEMLVTFGLRRGGDQYYTLGIGSCSDGSYIGGYSSPSWKWSITPGFLGTETLGQSWCTPRVGSIKVGGEIKTAVIFSGGYDPAQDNDHYDSGDPGKLPIASDSKGRAVFAVDASDGSLMDAINFNHSNYDLMTHCIVDLLTLDSDSDENHLIDTIYAGDMGGNLFAFHDREATGGTWNRQLLFKARSGSTANDWLKFMYYPAVKTEIWGDYVFIGTGDREIPDDAHTENYFYAVKNRWDGTTTLWSELQDVTSVTYDSALRSLLVSETCKGWFIKLSPGEKVVSYPVVYEYRDKNLIPQALIIFTTFTPDPTSDDECNVEVFGGARVYMLDYKTGIGMTDGSGNETERSIYIGKGMPSAPQIIYLKDEDDPSIVRAKLIITTAGNPSNSDNADDLAPLFSPDLPLPEDYKVGEPDPFIRYWKQN